MLALLLVLRLLLQLLCFSAFYSCIQVQVLGKARSFMTGDQSNVQYIDCINSRNLSFQLTDNQYADMTNEEFKSIYLGYKTRSPRRDGRNFTSDTVKLPATVDWRKQGAVTPIKDQGSCGRQNLHAFFPFRSYISSELFKEWCIVFYPAFYYSYKAYISICLLQTTKKSIRIQVNMSKFV